MRCWQVLCFVLACALGSNAFGAKVACVTITNPDTGDTNKHCMYTERETPVQIWSFLTAVRWLYPQETVLGFDYNSLYEDMVWSSFDNCQEVKDHLAANGGVLMSGHDCETLQERLESAWSEHQETILDTFESALTCESLVDLVGVTTGVVAVRVVLKKLGGKIIKEAGQKLATLESVRDQGLDSLRDLHRYDLIGAVVGYVFGDIFNEMICNAIDDWLQEYGHV